MPTTLTGLLLFIVLLLPGFAYMTAKERNTPAARRSPFRETVEIVAASVTSELIILAAFLGATSRLAAPGVDITALLSQGSAYFDTRPYMPVFAWSAGLLALATIYSGAAGWLLGRKPPHASKMSAWWEMFETWYPGFNTHVACTLDDGSYVEGIVNSYSDLAEETADRDIILQAPIQLRFPGETELQPYTGGAVCVSARHIVMMMVTPLTTRCGEVISSPVATSGPAQRVAPAAVAEEDSAAAGPAHVPDPVQVSAHGYDRSRRSPSRSSTPRDRACDRRGSFVEPIVARTDGRDRHD